MSFETLRSPRARLKLRNIELPEGLAPSNFHTPQRVNEFRSAGTMLEVRMQALQKESEWVRQQANDRLAAEKEAMECALALELYNSVKLLNHEYEKFANELLENANSLIRYAWEKLMDQVTQAEIVQRLLEQAQDKLESRAYLEVLYHAGHAEDVLQWVQTLEAKNIFLDGLKFTTSADLRKNCIKLAAKRGGFVIFDFREQEVSILEFISSLVKTTETV